MRFPWVSRSTFRAVLEAKNEVIAYQREHIRELREALARPVAVTVTLPKDFAILTPAVVSKPSRKKKRDDVDAPAAMNLDLSEVDENNLEVLGTIAVAKYGRKAHNKWELKQWIRGIQIEIRAAKADKRRKQQKEQAEPAPEVGELQKGLELDEPIDESAIPAHIRQMVSAAEGGE